MSGSAFKLIRLIPTLVRHKAADGITIFRDPLIGVTDPSDPRSSYMDLTSR